AVELGFASIVGVEYCEDFYRRSLRNITAAKLPEDAKKNIQVPCVDAAQYLPPETHCVLYFFNPFDEELLSSVMAKILISYAHRPRNMYIIYYNPWYRKVIDRMIGFDIIAEGDLGRK
ncbi:MAG: hypothetical protein KAV87_51895, partial [Desulfobacteraceae bacterium]|nr:hypothetical protein [Desulfobacteraceae bacterium]